jgi:hypothetical protein
VSTSRRKKLLKTPSDCPSGMYREAQLDSLSNGIRSDSSCAVPLGQSIVTACAQVGTDRGNIYEWHIVVELERGTVAKSAVPNARSFWVARNP